MLHNILDYLEKLNENKYLLLNLFDQMEMWDNTLQNEFAFSLIKIFTTKKEEEIKRIKNIFNAEITNILIKYLVTIIYSENKNVK